ncbi:ribonuclease P/MRP, subunit POP7 [Purpureocillium lilacinum]|nr:ribonuclease P/MRP, subunit POP7 [Purpureocillium lilacinum]OAQ85106.1 ribonuclease P/MRP, subunit POP7 [Purpureocillium lilacinum]OAQ89651.1 ribonuclease P/MRP, subunit POP7 [Purpureocillium lilacinum]GJN69347.1 hypothetical protein PLICBS_003395 [Purpureocillium lilacinum]GJN76975.1 hypothetical protein PLIIFM63780_000463 [Purpureocillium lilacinum]
MAPPKEISKGSAPSAKAPPPPPQDFKKLPPIPKGSKVQKRPLTRRQLPSSSKTPVVYVSSSTPFMSAVRRVQKYLDRSLRNATAAAPRNASLHARVEGLRRRAAAASATTASGQSRGSAAAGGADGGDDADPGATRVTVMGTGRAVEKVLGVAGWFEQKGDCVVALRTGTVGAVDDIVAENGEAEDESRIRMVSCLEVVVSLK